METIKVGTARFEEITRLQDESHQAALAARDAHDKVFNLQFAIDRLESANASGVYNEAIAVLRIALAEAERKAGAMVVESRLANFLVHNAVNPRRAVAHLYGRHGQQVSRVKANLPWGAPYSPDFKAKEIYTTPDIDEAEAFVASWEAGAVWA